MSYQVLARKWRPRKFAELVGQEHVVRALTNALDTGRMHHAYLFTGTRGVGKTTIARIFAKSLNCERGQSADPCGECSVCTAVDEGRFVDLLEIDAASNTGVDDVREVIENAQYAPSRGRFKVYLVDEVHMLSKNAFNALLKTLEEPPPHVKFLLATTDPQKLPVTVLSRCLKFNLKRLLPEQISGQMRHILGAENIAYEDGAIGELARAADGSLRDGLSLLDQAIAYGGGALHADDVRNMLGSVARGQVLGVLDALAAGDGERLLVECTQIASYSPDFGGVLDDIASVLHRLQLIQLIPGYRPDEDGADDDALTALAGRITPEDVQLYYQIATAGRRDLALAPDARTGFEMALLRMLAFRPGDGVPAVHAERPATVGPAAAARPAPAAPMRPAATLEPRHDASPPRTTPAPTAAPAGAAAPVARDADGLPDWEALIERAGLRGPFGLLAQNAVLRERDGQTLVLALQPAHMSLAVEPMVSQMEERIGHALGERIRLRFVNSSQTAAAQTPAARAAQARDAAQAAAEQAIEGDPLVQSLKREFGARVVPQSIKPFDSESGAV
ncbi:MULTISPECIES: DNA polymerase III subunit gamma/tau [Rhodanobacter]|uniref:DNA polymerase III subunit gamma/tau n=1 Tax=Rhodanobacter TaxID=75309 RepID=UPI0004059527|nr:MULTISPECIES: DNA polymerase III subunit gamma/tau [Rhodanobacter]KZC21519.1 DNA polymerase III subunit gamma/tau [Rhodanobacter denitrificans]UJJ52461.1 DNA polymerase III subunit gamma/tau [Rhodanobacter denitrificans]UJM95214.1 DNA polymerase III subunit gamma/tau [Rhodanobacter denitrificans]UJM98745.1 DNA polymerase III subunit gamma/tau [Rhodanobacter denitrificans]UJN21840.1 DNA polymerase III subunit gamma/tau [Rhodanobacter denitrificans]